MQPHFSLKPEATHDFIALGRARVLDYQNAAYAQLFDSRVARLRQAESSAPGRLEDATAQSITAEAARWLALWMCYDDIVRVADLKSRALRTSRVRLEARAQDGDLLQVYEHFKPGVPEFASLLPSGLARRLRAWDARRAAAGRDPWAMPLRVGSHTVMGMLSLRLLANLKGLRPTSSRYAEEQELIERWLTAVEAGTTQSHALGWELAQCGRLIKGYGSTNERAKANLLHIVAELAAPQRMHSAGFDPAACAAAVAAARESALKDATGKALDQALQQHGAAPRPIAPQPIRWVRKPPARQNAPVA